MEAAGSVAGLVSLAGLVVEGIQTLRTFCLNYGSAGTDIADTAEDLSSLSATIGQLSTIQVDSTAQKSTIALLRRSILTCKDDIDHWLVAVEAADFRDKKGLKRFAKRLTTTFDFSRRSDLRQKIASHRSQLALVVELLGRDADLHHMRRLESLQHSQDQSFARSMQCMEDGFGSLKLSQATLGRIEGRLESMQRQLVGANQRKAAATGRKRRGTSLRKAPLFSAPPKSQYPQETAVTRAAKSEQPHMLMRMVKTAFLVQETNGQPVVEMLAVADKQFEAADEKTKLSMIQYIQSLRLLVWLLRRDNLSTTAARFCDEDDYRGPISRSGALNTGYKRLVVSSEFLRWRQFSFVQKLHSPLHGGSVPVDSSQIVRSYFMTNDYGRDLFQFYLSLPKLFDQEEYEKVSEPDSNDPAWVQARWLRMSLFMRYLDGETDHLTHSTYGRLALLPQSSADVAREPTEDLAAHCDGSWTWNEDLANATTAATIPLGGTAYLRSDEMLGDCSSTIDRAATFDSAIDLSHDVEMSDAPGAYYGVDDTDHLTSRLIPASKAALRSTWRASEHEDNDVCYASSLESTAARQFPHTLRSQARSGTEDNSAKTLSPEAFASHKVPFDQNRVAEVVPLKRRKYQNRIAQQFAARRLRSTMENQVAADSGHHKAHYITTSSDGPAWSHLAMTPDPSQAQNADRWEDDHNAQLILGERKAPVLHDSPNAHCGNAADYQMRLMLLEQQNKRRLILARHEQDKITRSDTASSQPKIGTARTEKERLDMGQVYAASEETKDHHELGGWRQQLSLEDRAQYGSQLTQAIRELRSSQDHFAFIGDWDIWHKAMNTEANIYVRANSYEDYVSRLADHERLIKSLSLLPKNPEIKAQEEAELIILDALESNGSSPAAEEHGKHSLDSWVQQQQLRRISVEKRNGEASQDTVAPDLSSHIAVQAPIQLQAAHHLRDVIVALGQPTNAQRSPPISRQKTHQVQDLSSVKPSNGRGCEEFSGPATFRPLAQQTRPADASTGMVQQSAHALQASLASDRVKKVFPDSWSSPAPTNSQEVKAQPRSAYAFRDSLAGRIGAQVSQISPITQMPSTLSERMGQPRSAHALRDSLVSGVGEQELQNGQYRSLSPPEKEFLAQPHSAQTLRDSLADSTGDQMALNSKTSSSPAHPVADAGGPQQTLQTPGDTFSDMSFNSKNHADHKPARPTMLYDSFRQQTGYLAPSAWKLHSSLVKGSASTDQLQYTKMAGSSSPKPDTEQPVSMVPVAVGSGGDRAQQLALDFLPQSRRQHKSAHRLRDELASKVHRDEVAKPAVASLPHGPGPSTVSKVPKRHTRLPQPKGAATLHMTGPTQRTRLQKRRAESSDAFSEPRTDNTKSRQGRMAKENSIPSTVDYNDALQETGEARITTAQAFPKPTPPVSSRRGRTKQTAAAMKLFRSLRGEGSPPTTTPPTATTLPSQSARTAPLVPSSSSASGPPPPPSITNSTHVHNNAGSNIHDLHAMTGDEEHEAKMWKVKMSPYILRYYMTCEK